MARTYGWLEITTGNDSSIVYTQTQVATQHGYDSMLLLHLDSVEIASSVNYQTFLSAKSCRVCASCCPFAYGSFR